jgi:acetyl esterase/lipase
MDRILNILVSGIAASALWAAPAQWVYKTNRDRDLKMDIAYPAGWQSSDRRAFVLFFYNGGWGKGTPERQFDEQALYFQQRGAVTARADYRVKNRDGVELPRKCIEDVLSAVRWARRNATSIGIDPQKIVIGGGSGSAHLVASVAYAGEFDDPRDDPSISPIANAMFVYHPDVDDLTPAMFTRMKTATTARALPPTIVFIGSRDPMYEMTKEWTAALRGHGARLDTFVGEGGIHGFYKFTPWLEKTTLRADELLRSLGILSVQPVANAPSLRAPPGYGKRTEENQARWLERHKSRTAPPVPEYVYQTYSERKLRMVFHYPDGWSRADRRPVILFLSGGAHNPRDKNGDRYPLAAERAAKGMPAVNDGPGNAFNVEAEYFSRRGMVAGRVEYRQRKDDGVLPDESMRDAALAIRWVRRNAGKLGVDPDRLVAAGGSGGGHLVAGVAALKDVHRIEGATPDALILHYPLLDWLEGGSMTERFLDALDNDRELAVRLSPSRHWSAEMPPTLLFIGSKEPTFEANRAFAEKWTKAGALLELFVGERAGHGFSTVSPWMEKATVRSDEFLRKLGYLGPEPRVPPPSRTRPKKSQ